MDEQAVCMQLGNGNKFTESTIASLLRQRTRRPKTEGEEGQRDDDSLFEELADEKGPTGFYTLTQLGFELCLHKLR